MELDPDQKHALAQLEAGESIFLTGGAGAGKSEVLKRFLRSRPDAVSMASTAAAAHLIGGTTVHRFFGFPIGVMEPGGQAHPAIRQRLTKAPVLVFDEVSMLRIDLLQGIRDRLFSAARGYGDWAGYQVVMTGDFAQLPPVVTDREKPALEGLYGQENVFAFQSPVWGNLKPCTLTHLHRQADDLAFAELLKTMREGRIPDLSMLDARVAPPRQGCHPPGGLEPAGRHHQPGEARCHPGRLLPHRGHGAGRVQRARHAGAAKSADEARRPYHPVRQRR